MARLHYYCDSCDGTWLAEAEVMVEADCLFCGVRDVFPYKSDNGRAGRAKLAVFEGAKATKPPARAGKLKRSA
jgi:hypothetical protein